MTKNVLVIANSLEEQVHLLLLLTAGEFTPTCCACLPSALSALESETFDAILTEPIIQDAPPQKITAVEFISLVRKDARNTATPIVVMGDVFSFEYIMNTLRSGIARFIPKPFTSTELLETISAEISLSKNND